MNVKSFGHRSGLLVLFIASVLVLKSRKKKMQFNFAINSSHISFSDCQATHTQLLLNIL